LLIMAINGVAIAFFGLVQQLTWNGRLFWQVPLEQGGEPFGPFVDRNHAGGFLTLCLAAPSAPHFTGAGFPSIESRRPRTIIGPLPVPGRACSETPFVF